MQGHRSDGETRVRDKVSPKKAIFVSNLEAALMVVIIIAVKSVLRLKVQFVVFLKHFKVPERYF